LGQLLAFHEGIRLTSITRPRRAQVHPSIVPRRAIYYARLLIYDSRRETGCGSLRVITTRLIALASPRPDGRMDELATQPKHAGGLN